MRAGAATAKTRPKQPPSVQPVPSAARRRGVWRLAPPVSIAVLTVFAFLPTLRNGFVAWDDDRNFVENPHFRGLGVDQLRWMWTTFHMGHYVPLSWMTLGMDYTLWGMNPLGYHLTSVLLHAANALVVYYLALTVLDRNRESSTDSETSVIVAASFAALVFAVHPLRVESVAWATERRDVLSGLFFFSSILAYLHAATAPNLRRRYWLSLALFVCALLSKATSMSLPAVLLIVNVYPLRRLGGVAGWTSPQARRVYLEIAPFALLAAATAGLSIIALHPPNQLGVAAKLGVSAYSLLFYLWKTALPVGLSPLYEMPQHVDPLEVRFVVSELLVVTLAGVAWWLRRRRAAITASLALFFVVTLPMLGVVQNGPQIAADRYTYHAAPALAFLAGAALLATLRSSFVLSSVVASVVVVALASLTARQSAVWQDSGTLWARVLEVDDRSSIAHSAMSNVLYRQNRVAEGVEHSERAVALAPDYPQALNALGVGLAREGRVADAIANYRHALAVNAAYDDAEANLGIALAQQGDANQAIEHYRRALEINPNNSNAHVNWGNALVRMNRLDEAIVHYRAALSIRRDNAEAQHNWGVALAQQKRYAQAIEHFQAALAIDPNHAEARQYLELATRLLREQGGVAAPP
jgi:protein O-mannosyl-transferase